MLLTKIKISSKDNIVSRLATEKEVKVDVVRCSANGMDGGASILRIESKAEASAEEIVNWFRENEGCSVVSISSISPGRHLLTVRNPRCRWCHAFLGSDCFLESGSSDGNGSVIWKIFAPNNTSLKGMIERLRKEGCKVDLLSVKKAVPSYELTKTQSEAVRLAFLMGYYDIPKRVTLDELALRSGVSKATLNIILRRGQKKILSEHLGK
jgi:predicted DNA binding protein